MRQSKWAIGRERLLALAGVLDAADAVHKIKGERTYTQKNWVNPCGAPACAFGHYAAMFPKRFELEAPSWMHTGGAITIKETGDQVRFSGREINDEFGIRDEETEDLFGFSGCGGAKTGKDAAAYIRQFVARKDRAIKRKNAARRRR